MTNTKLVTLSLASASFVVEGNTNEELLENAKIAMAEQLATGKFPHITYSISDANALTFENAFPGQIVESKDGNIGIVTGVNKKTINVTYTNNRSVQGSPGIFKLSNVPFEQARSKRRNSSIEMDYWMEGESGYFKNDGEIHEVVIGKITRGKAKVHVVNTKSSFTLPEEKLSFYIKNEIAEVQM